MFRSLITNITLFNVNILYLDFKHLTVETLRRVREQSRSQSLHKTLDDHRVVLKLKSRFDPLYRKSRVHEEVSRSQ